MPILPINSANKAPSKQANVIPQVGRKKFDLKNQINFSGHGESEESNHWFIKLLLILAGGYVAYKCLKNPVKHIVTDFSKDDFIDLFKKAEKKEIMTWKDVEEHMRELHKSNKGIQTGFLMRLTDDQRTMFNVVPNEGIAMGYKVGNRNVISKTVVCDKLDEKFLTKLGNDFYYQFT